MKTYNLMLFLTIFIFGSCIINEKEKASDSLPDDLSKIKVLLDTVHVEDQKHRAKTSELIEQFGEDSKEMEEHWALMRKTDSSNLYIVEKVLEKFGWLGSEEIGKDANSAIFLVIQHSDLEIQEKYLPMMQKAVKEGKARGNSLALLEDRINLRKGKFQVYGSQMGTDPDTGEIYVKPLIEPESVNERRVAVGLMSIESYVSHWGVKWDVEAYKKNLPRYVKLLND